MYYEPKKDQPPPSEWEFTAAATFGSCELDPPYDIYYGTGEPGTKITITSKYGGGTATVDAAGDWEKKVIFAEAPYDEPFPVTVKDKYGSKKKFEFVAYQPG